VPQALFNSGNMIGVILLLNLINLLSIGVSISAKRSIVLEDVSITGAIVRGWRLMWARFNDYFVIAALMLLLGLLFSILFFATVAPGLFSSSDMFGTITSVSILINLLIGSFTSLFISSVWTLAFRKWQSR
jgi:hypothetical protein